MRIIKTSAIKALGLVAIGGLLALAPARADTVPPFKGNDTGGIIPYAPAVEHVYRDLAAAHCAQWKRLSHITSVHRRYGDYISFSCIDKPGIVH